MESKEYLDWCKKNNLDSSLVKNYYKYQNEMEYQDYLNSIYEEGGSNE